MAKFNEMDVLEAMGAEPCEVCGEPSSVTFSDHQRLNPTKSDLEIVASVAKHRLLKQVNGGVVLYQRHRPLEVHAFCKEHLRPPRIYGPNGRLIERR